MGTRHVVPGPVRRHPWLLLSLLLISTPTLIGAWMILRALYL